MPYTKKYSPAIDNLRALSIIAIVFTHSHIGTEVPGHMTLSFIAYNQVVKFGSLTFMIISGYLFEQSIRKYTTKELFKKRIRTILKPFVILVAPWLVYQLIIEPFVGPYQIEFSDYNLTFLLDRLKMVFFFSPYWFVINLLFIQLVNIFCISKKKHKRSLLLFFVISLFYSINIYYGWAPRTHLTAIFGFFSFFIFGRCLSKYKNTAKSITSKILQRKPLYLTMIVITFAAAIFEARIIDTTAPAGDALNILRISNILLSILLLPGFYAIIHKISLYKIFIPKSVFLIYLIHPYILFFGFMNGINSLATLAFYHSMYLIIDFIYGLAVLIVSISTARLLLRLPILNRILGERNFKTSGSKENATPSFQHQMNLH